MPLRSAEEGVLRGLLIRSGLDDPTWLTRYFGRLAAPDSEHSRWKMIVLLGGPKAKAKSLRERWRVVGPLAENIEAALREIRPPEGPLAWRLVTEGIVDAEPVAAAIERRAEVAGEGRRVAIPQLLIDGGALTAAAFVDAIDAAGQRLLWCADCTRYAWLAASEGSPICDECQGKLRPRSVASER